ncbi:expressed unknown protein [Seminavis robusta]|uniref:AB hydrolase-1 domain-containing protein n=1 Tax=Seminavis robusta TaxID=568900 RepID=A0A9N8EQ90_9STRA|nr:expressed unknown protein [Seminavis robusta]|eukprot:Sro1658_g289160.1 n/a (535) ;mRNA; f:14878-16584
MWLEGGIVTKVPPVQTERTMTTTTAATTRKPTMEKSGSTGGESLLLSSTTTRLYSTADGTEMDLPYNNDMGVSSSTEDQQSFAVHPDEPNLYQIPAGLHPIYQPLPVMLQVTVWLVSAVTAALWTYYRKQQKLTWVSPLVALANNQVSIKRLLGFVVKTLVMATVSQTLLQELLTPPTRIATQDLIRKYILPSKLSQFESVPLQLPSATDGTTSTTTTDLGVHYLQYQQQQTTQSPQPQFQALYMNHGFGASSLSWLPVLPRMVDRLRTRVGLGHDAVGFGFTDRPATKSAFTPTGSAAIGTSLLQPKLLHAENSDDDKPVLLMGHSMGSLATLQMALSLPSNTRKWVVLVAPALGMRPTIKDNRKQSKGPLKWVSQGFAKGGSAIGRYGLRRLVGGKNFWRKGLETVWGDSKRLLDGDVLRFQWPAIGLGWEDGMLRFTQAMATEPTTLTDQELVEQVLNADSNAVITVIVGGNDKVVSSKVVQNFLAPYGDRIRIVEMAGLGHDPFEEDVDGFINLLEQLLEEDKERILINQ